MTILIFIIILMVLIIVHEAGHFIAAKKLGIRVDEFGVGFPPKIATLFKKGETSYTLNAIPFGGFVKIFGENPNEEASSGPDSARSFMNKPRWAQAIVLVAGVTFNVLFAWLLISIGLMWGLPASVSYSGDAVHDPKFVVITVSPESPAALAGLKTGDEITGVRTDTAELHTLTPEGLSGFVAKYNDSDIVLNYKREGGDYESRLTPASGILTGKKAIGVSSDMIGILQLPPHKALWKGADITVKLTQATAIGLGAFFIDLVSGGADLSQVTGPVGIVGLVGDASTLGFAYLISFAAFISINLAIINLIPFPALDGGRLLFVAIEAIKRSPINPKVTNIANAIGFVLLLLLMVIVTIHDVVKLF